jgi:hypothetical protein
MSSPFPYVGVTPGSNSTTATPYPPSTPPPGSSPPPPPPHLYVSADELDFYGQYDPMEGVTTAVVLGGFFVFVCLLVVYKTKLKPLWKERNRRLHNTPATRSAELASSFSHLHKASRPHRTVWGGGGQTNPREWAKNIKII